MGRVACHELQGIHLLEVLQPILLVFPVRLKPPRRQKPGGSRGIFPMEMDCAKVLVQTPVILDPSHAKGPPNMLPKSAASSV